MPLFTETTGFPPTAIGPAGNQSLLGVHTLQMGNPSTIATHYGIAGITASLVSPGRYFLRGPKAPTDVPRSVRIFCQGSKPVVGSGAALISTYNLQPGSGTYEIHGDYPTSTTSVFAAADVGSGTYIDTFWFVTPVTTF